MRILNVNEEAPEYYYVFTNRCEDAFFEQVLRHNYEIQSGQMISGAFPRGMASQYIEQYRSGTAWYLPFVPAERQMFGSLTPFASRMINRYWLEYNLELARMQRFPLLPSRLTCLYAFGNIDDCVNRSKKYKRGNWRLSDLKKFKILDCGPDNDLIRIARCNSSMIGAFEHFPFYLMSPEEQEALFSQYWSGGETLDGMLELSGFDPAPIKCKNVFEYLIEGILEEVPFSEDEALIIKR